MKRHRLPCTPFSELELQWKGREGKDYERINYDDPFYRLQLTNKKQEKLLVAIGWHRTAGINESLNYSQRAKVVVNADNRSMSGILAGFNSQTEYGDVIVGSVALQLAGKVEADGELSAQITPHRTPHWVTLRVEEIIHNPSWRQFCLPYPGASAARGPRCSCDVSVSAADR